MNEVGTAEISGVQAKKILSHFLDKMGNWAKVPKTNGYVKLHNGVTLRKLHPRFRKSKSKAFHIKGDVETMRELSSFLQTREGKSITMKISKNK